MKIAHLLHYHPHRSGLYESARELIAAECRLGHDARFVDGRMEAAPHPYLWDRETRSADPKFLNEADIVVAHQMIRPSLFEAIKKPMILMLHGTPRDCMWGELYEGTKSYTAILNLINDDRFVGFVTLWKEHIDFWKCIVPENKLFYIPAFADLKVFTPDGETHDFNPSGSPNIVFADTWRIDKNPFEILHAYRLFKGSYPNARLHLFAKSRRGDGIWDRLMNAIALGRDDFYGHVEGMVQDLPKVLRAADFVISPVTLANRLVRESLACGVPLVAGRQCKYTPYSADHYAPQQFCEAMIECWKDVQKDRELCRNAARQMAEQHFNVRDAAYVFVKILEGILEGLTHRKSYEKALITL